MLALYLGPFSTRGFESTCTAWICVPKCVDLSPGVPRGVHAARQSHAPCVDFHATCPRVTLGPRSPTPRDACIPRNVPERDPRGITHVYCPARVTLVPRVYCPARVKSRIFKNRVIFADVTSLRITSFGQITTFSKLRTFLNHDFFKITYF